MWEKLKVIFKGDRRKGFESLDADEFIKKLALARNAALIDVRTPEEFASGHLAGAINFNLHSPDFLRQIEELPKDKAYFIYCRSGQRSSLACEMLIQRGCENVFEMKCGTTYYLGKLQRPNRAG